MVVFDPRALASAWYGGGDRGGMVVSSVSIPRAVAGFSVDLGGVEGSH